MYQDAKEELKRLEDALLEEELLEEALAEEEFLEDEELSQEPEASLEETRRITQLPKGFYNTDHTDVELEEYAQQVQEDTRGLTGLTVTAILLAAGIVGILIWWVLRYGGMLG
ncbi:MAG: hypothetical protein IJB47_02765 [Oscillospiraceae bacterium]|nr:hypothetical protein [Oscillospiraceae bacterium]